MSLGCDTTANISTSILQTLKNGGYAFVGRNLAGGSSALSPAEAKLISDGGIYICSFWENGSPSNASYFTASKGTSDALSAISAARAVGQSTGTPIYFKVNYNATDSEVNGCVKEYLQAVKAVFVNQSYPYALGLYGSGAVLDYYKNTFTYCWLARDTTWRLYTFTGYCLKQGSSISIGGGTSYREDSNGSAGGWKSSSPVAPSEKLQYFAEQYTNMVIQPSSGSAITVKVPYYLGGKILPSAIKDKVIATFFDAATGTWKKTASLIQTDIDNNKAVYGVDCSGFVYYVLNEATKVNTNDSGKLNANWNVSYAYGISADNLSSSVNGAMITKAQDIIPGCTFRSDNGNHVLVVYKVEKNTVGTVTKVLYAHSNGSNGPHTGYITIGDSSKDLGNASQTWSDVAYTDATAKNYYNQTIWLNCLK